MATTDKFIGNFKDNLDYEFKVIYSESGNGTGIPNKSVALFVKPPENKMESFLKDFRSKSPEYVDTNESQIRTEGYAIKLGGNIHTFNYPATAEDRTVANELWYAVWKGLGDRGIPVSTPTKNRVKELAATAVKQMSMGIAA